MEGISIYTGFETLLIEALHIETKEPLVELRRDILGLRFP